MSDDTIPPVHSSAADLQPTAWRQFAAWPGATSLITLLSAALLLLGLHGVLAPALADEMRVAPRWQVLGTLTAYLGALLCGVWAMCRARAGNPDAVASAVVGAALAVGCGVVVHLLAAAQPLGAAIAACVGWIGILWLGRAFDRVSGGAGWAGAGLVLGILYAWVMLWPLLLAAIVAREAQRMPTAGAGAPGTDAAVMAWWTVGWGVLLAIILALLPRVRIPDGGSEPVLATAAMRWILALVAVAAAIIALAVQAHIAGLDISWGDVLPHIAALLLLAGTCALAAWGRHPLRDAAAVGVPALLSAGLALAGAVPSSSAFRGAGWAPDLVAACGVGPLLPLLLAAGGTLLGWRRKAPGMLWGAWVAIAAALVAWDPQRPLLAEAALVGAAGVVVAALRMTRPSLAVAALVVAAGAVPATRPATGLLGDLVAEPVPMLCAAWACLLLCAAWRPAWVASGWARAAAWLLGLVAAGTALLLLAGRRSTGLPGGAVADACCVAAVLGLILVCAWRRRDPALAVAAGPAGAVLAWPLLALLGRAWLAVLAAFALLGSGVLLAVRRARISRS